jgi:hypothetical protein
MFLATVRNLMSLGITIIVVVCSRAAPQMLGVAARRGVAGVANVSLPWVSPSGKEVGNARSLVQAA